MIKKNLALALGLLFGQVANAVVSDELAAKLGSELTPLGAIRAADGDIPEWTGGFTDIPEGYKKGGHLVDPFPNDKPLFSVTAANLDQHSDLLSVGQKTLLKQYESTYRLDVYPTRRTAAYPQWLYDETIKNASRVSLTNDGNGFSGAAKGYPFPIPQTGQEAMWNHIVRYRTTGVKGHFNYAIVEPGGDYVVERAYVELASVYNNPKISIDKLKNRLGYVMVKTVAPASKAGDAFLIHLPLDRIEKQAQVWTYNRGQRKVIRIGKVGYDNPVFNALLTQDQIDMFNGPMDRYDFELLGKREMLIPYNGYRAMDTRLKYREIIQANHPNPDYVRYEKHRVWVVEANLKPEAQHLYKKRVFYLDEDSWQIVLQDVYDQRGDFWRSSEAHPLVYYGYPFVENSLQVHYDVQGRRYAVLNLINEEKKPPDFSFDPKSKYFSPLSLKRFAR